MDRGIRRCIPGRPARHEATVLGPRHRDGQSILKVHGEAVQPQHAVDAAARGDRDGLTRHQPARVELAAERFDDGVDGPIGDPVIAQDLANGVVTPHRQTPFITAGRTGARRKGAGEGESGAACAIEAVRGASRFDEAARLRFDARRQQGPPPGAVGSEEKPDLAPDGHVAQVRFPPDRLADAIGIDRAHTGLGQHGGQGIAAFDPQCLERGSPVGCGFGRRRRRRAGCHGGRYRERKDRHSVNPPARAVAHVRGQPPDDDGEQSPKPVRVSDNPTRHRYRAATMMVPRGFVNRQP